MRPSAASLADRSVGSITDAIRDALDRSWTGVLDRFERDDPADRSIERSVEPSGADGRGRLAPLAASSELFVLLLLLLMVGILTLSSGR